MSKLTAQRLRELLDYDPATGSLVWRIPRPRCRVGGEAGWSETNGYRRIHIDGETHQAHRLAWLHVTGVWPSDQIDHINGVRSDNRFVNLRDVDNAENQQNQRLARCTNELGVLGVGLRDGKYVARITAAGRSVYLGRHLTAEAADAAYRRAKVALHPTAPTIERAIPDGR